jgi:hypothetical protein
VLGVVAVAACLALYRLGARRGAGRAVRRALTAADPDTRRAAVLVAVDHGLGRYAQALCRRVTTEEADSVLVPLAEAVAARGGRGRRGRCGRLQRWAEAFLAGRTVRRPEGAPRRTTAPAPRGRVDDGAAHGLDALELVEALGPLPRQPSAGPPASARPRRQWRADPDELDALKVVDALRAGPRRRASAKSAPNGRSTPAGTTDIDALLNELAGVARVAPRRSRPREPYVVGRAAGTGSRAS